MHNDAAADKPKEELGKKIPLSTVVMLSSRDKPRRQYETIKRGETGVAVPEAGDGLVGPVWRRQPSLLAVRWISHAKSPFTGFGA
ncbi:hypothetical protein GRAQ_04993 [Rahnella aquatilis CIP 78.65 = ATCC 33071]|uniref:Uncharacterized protein n=1 Tax=Rahnella aquatilis (strain ATCC 33071 / DSM 4594 / JCM 1683 / NBRC 105701 / NCIMB 13365 / CIP 78.65) TaxID=745277 RepID=H2J2M3_RAHAC|nr:hypothetical protein [Rahnella aquatilis]AEX54820.1 hypothetical protein Rahaq2_5121 [Rahnella aquatilis CIP 78.65 = ATCC 33071]KFC99473.1 hypothetical protein GRAQ_04993 [Rahnella aquatilis CIP 78.65 = ATCC 33071]